ncbi:MAG TPA: hypothetical protein PKW45_04395, partial [Bryobacteraceae bacterium]|nr:hypothetical protein [Bryobacteraceae bacterium]
MGPAAGVTPTTKSEDHAPASWAGFGKWLAALVASAALLYWFLDPPVRHPPGVLVPEAPRQNLMAGITLADTPEYRVTALASFSARGLLLGRERYWWDRGSRLSPVDFVLGWGPMSDQSVIDRLIITQGRRWFQWRPKGRRLPIPEADIIAHSANMHLIPADAEVRSRLLRIRPGSVVSLSGYLVLVEGKDGSRWRSSLSRT